MTTHTPETIGNKLSFLEKLLKDKIENTGYNSLTEEEKIKLDALIRVHEWKAME